MHTEIKSTRIRPDDARRWGFATMASIDNPKASKATAYGYLNAILYMAPSDSAGVGNLCPHSGACRELCLGEHSGQAAIRREDEDNATTLARKARARAYMADRDAFMRYVVADILRLQKMIRAAPQSDGRGHHAKGRAVQQRTVCRFIRTVRDLQVADPRQHRDGTLICSSAKL